MHQLVDDDVVLPFETGSFEIRLLTLAKTIKPQEKGAEMGSQFNLEVVWVRNIRGAPNDPR